MQGGLNEHWGGTKTRQVQEAQHAQNWRFFDMEQEARSVARPAESSCDEEIRK